MSEVNTWITEMEGAIKREKHFRKAADHAVRIYECDSEDTSFNILYSNTEVLKPVLYNEAPRPKVKRRYFDEDPVGAEVSELTTRVLRFFVDNNDRSQTSFDELMTSAVLSSLIPGRGVSVFSYDAQISNDVVSYETVSGENFDWNRVYFGYARTWDKTPWICFEHFMDRLELEKNFGRDLAAKIPLTASEHTDSDSERLSKPPSDSDESKLARVWEIWDKSSRKIKFVCPEYTDGVLKESGDPLRLDGFFPIPKPLQFFTKVSSRVPVPLYSFYRRQAAELNKINNRILRLTEALKLRGFYDSTIDGIKDVLTADDNTFLPAENTASMRDGQTLDRALWLVPIEKIISVLQQLYVQREDCKRVIYEITGISDIVRGESRASETLGAQDLKSKWGSLRMRFAQAEVTRYIRDSLRIIAEIALKKFSRETIQNITNKKYYTTVEIQQAQQLISIGQQLGQSVPPQYATIAGAVPWEQIEQIIRNQLLTDYHIDIEPNSAVDIEATEEKANINEFLNAMAQFLNGIAPVVESGVIPFEAAKQIMLAIVRRFRFGEEVEKSLMAMAPQPKQNPAELEAAKKEIDKASQQIQAEKQKLAQDKLALEEAAQKEQMNLEKSKREIEQMIKEAESEQELFSRQLTLELQNLLKTAHMDAKDLFNQESMKRQAEKSKEKEAAEESESKEPEEDNTGKIIMALSHTIEGIGQQVLQAISANKATRRRAVKMPDGSWTSEVVQ